MKAPFALVFLGIALFASGCASGPKPTEETSYNPYQARLEFVWETAMSELKGSWHLASDNFETRTIVTEWDTNLSPLSSQGRRNRLTVVVTGDDVKGWAVTCTQETEANTDAEAPLNTKEASWDGVPNNGGLARKFLTNLDRQLRPNDAWKRDARR